jgi:hypothetical protein
MTTHWCYALQFFPPQVIKELENLFKKIHVNSPMRVVSFETFQDFGQLPRSSDRKTHEISVLHGNAKLVFISHRWFRPNEDPKIAHPDDEHNSKHKLVCAGIQKLAEQKKWNIQHMYLWLDFCGVEQDDVALLTAGVASLRGYISVCDAVLIPSREVPPAGSEWTVDRIAGEYGGRAWTRLESMSFYAVGSPELCHKLCHLMQVMMLGPALHSDMALDGKCFWLISCLQFCSKHNIHGFFSVAGIFSKAAGAS